MIPAFWSLCYDTAWPHQHTGLVTLSLWRLAAMAYGSTHGWRCLWTASCLLPRVISSACLRGPGRSELSLVFEENACAGKSSLWLLPWAVSIGQVPFLTSKESPSVSCILFFYLWVWAWHSSAGCREVSAKACSNMTRSHLPCALGT
jgi:hypothetical protein